jgi:formylglycine-generating enzyme required for sulfatase activity
MSVNNVVQRLRWIEPGHFLMGSPKEEVGRMEWEGPQHRVTISRGLWLADTACTQELWQAVMGENPSRFDANNRGGPQHPVECVSWHMIQAFLQAMRAKWPGCQATLPTEAEWEYACRAGSKTAFSFGETISTDQINFDGNNPCGEGETGEYRECTVPVKALPANKWGLYQMHGNVWEWCADELREYEDKAVGDPGLADALKVPGEGEAARVLRGGGWICIARNARSASRFHDRPGRLYGDTGFRLAFRS